MAQSTIDAPGEVELWGPVHLFPGVEYVAYALGATLGAGTLPDPALVVHDGVNIYATADDTLALGDDAYVVCKVPVEGDYLLDVGDASGGIGTYKTNLVVYQGDISFGSDPGTFGPGTEPPFRPDTLDPDPFSGFI